MACEEAEKKLIEAMDAYVRLEEELKPLLLAYVGAPGQPGEPIIPGSEKFERVERLTRERDAAFQRYQAALAAFIEARKRHRD